MINFVARSVKARLGNIEKFIYRNSSQSSIVKTYIIGLIMTNYERKNVEPHEICIMKCYEELK